MKKYSKLMAVLLVVAMILPGIAQAAPVTEEVNGVNVTRLGGTDRIGTSVLASEAAYKDGADAVVLAGFGGDVDALTGTLLAANKKAPLLVTRQFELSDAVKTEIERLGAKTVYILGGETAVGEEVETALEAMTGITVERVEGANRNATAAEVAKEVKGTSADHVFLALGRMPVETDALADALAIGPVSAMEDMPVLLAETNRLPAETIAAMKDLGTTKVTIVGGKSAISQEVEDMLTDFTVDRVAGDSREKTALAIAAKYFAEPSNLIVAYGRKSADALVGGYLGAKWNAPILLTNHAGLTAETKAYIEDHVLDTYVLGGTTVVPQTAFDQIVAALEGEEVDELMVESVSAINAKTLKVEFNRAVTEAEQADAKFDVKRGTIATTVTAKWAEDGKSLELARGANLIAGDYTVTVTGLAEEALVGTVKVEAEKLTKINFLSDIAVISDDNVVATVTAENQYGELITSKLNTGNANISATTSKGTSVSIDNNGRLVVAGTSGLFKADDKLVVTIVDSTTGVTASKTLTVAQAAAVESIEIGELTTDDEALAKKPLNVANYDHTKFYIPVEVKDQYGNVLKAADLNGSVTVASSNKNIINPASTLFVDTNDGVILDLQAADSSQTHGTAVLTFVAAGTGKTANTSITILENYKLDVVTLEAPSTELKLGVETELPITIVNTYGDTVALKDVTDGGLSTALTLDGNTTITAIGADLAVVKDYVNDKSVLEITPSAKNITLTVVTATGKSQVLSLTASEAPVVSSIRGLNKNFVSVLANDTSLNTNLSGAVEFSDQYGNKIAAPAFDAADGTAALDYTIKVKGTATATDLASGIITAKTTAGTDTYQVILKDDDGTVLDTFDVTIKVVNAKDIKEFGIEDLDKFYTGATSVAHDQQVLIYGLVNGQKVKVNQGMIADVSATNGLAIGTDGAYTADFKDTKDADVASIITVLVENTANGNTYELTQDVVYNSEAPKATSLVVEYDGVEVTSGVVGVPASEINSKVFTPHASASKLQFIAEDQYGVDLTGGYNVVATIVDAAGSITGTYTGADLAGYAAGDSFQLNVRNGNFSKSVKVVVE